MPYRVLPFRIPVKPPEFAQLEAWLNKLATTHGAELVAVGPSLDSAVSLYTFRVQSKDALTDGMLSIDE